MAQSANLAAATLSAAATQASLAATPAAGTVVAMLATQHTITAQSTSDAMARATQAAINAEQVSATRSAISIAVTQEAQRQSDATTAQAMWNYLKVCFGVVLLLVFASAAVLAITLAQHGVDRRRVQSMLHSTPNGLYLVYVSGDRIVSRPVDALERQAENQGATMLSGPIERAGSGPVAMETPSRALLVRDSAIDSPQRAIPWLDSAQQVTQRQQQATTLSDVLLLLRDAMDATRPSGTKVPRYDRLKHWKTRPADWGRVTNVLVRCGYAEKRSGPPPAGGTFITGGRSLYTLSAQLQSGALKLRPLSTAGQVNAAASSTDNVTYNVS